MHKQCETRNLQDEKCNEIPQAQIPRKNTSPSERYSETEKDTSALKP